eukprot:scaffold17836_cov61-Phaeocystis_antarctica.AAC.1
MYCTRSTGSTAAASMAPPLAVSYSAPSSRSNKAVDAPSKATWCTVSSSRWRASPATRTSRQRSTAAPEPSSSKPSDASAAATAAAAAALGASASRSNAPPLPPSPSPPPAIACTRCTKPPSASTSNVVRSTACRVTSASSAACSAPTASGPHSQSASGMLYAASAPPPPACTVSSCDWFHETGYASPGCTPPASGSSGGSNANEPSPSAIASLPMTSPTVPSASINPFKGIPSAPSASDNWLRNSTICIEVSPSDSYLLFGSTVEPVTSVRILQAISAAEPLSTVVEGGGCDVAACWTMRSPDRPLQRGPPRFGLALTRVNGLEQRVHVELFHLGTLYLPTGSLSDRLGCK